MRLPVYERQAGVGPLSIANVQPNQPISDNGQEAGKAIHDVFARLQKFRDDQDDTRTLELLNKFKHDVNDYHENPDKGIYPTRIGKYSQGVFQEADQWMRSKGEEYVRDLPNERTKYVFRKKAQEIIEQMGVQNSRFEADQSKKYRIETAQAAIDNSLNAIEKNWNNSDFINLARLDIQQALELKLRGSGQEAFDKEYAQIEDKIGVARIRQAYAKHPLLALDMLKHQDIKLLPETFAKLLKSLTNDTEVYELQAIAQSFSKRYTQNNAVAARDELLRIYGADKGQKAFQALTQIWSVDNYQKSSREKNIQEAQEKNEERMLRLYADKNLTQQEVYSAWDKKSIRPQFGLSMIGRIQSDLDSAQSAMNKAQQQAEKQRRAENGLRLWEAETRGEFIPEEEIIQHIREGNIDEADGRRHINAKKAADKEHQQTLKEKNEAIKELLIRAMQDGDLTDEIIFQARDAGWIKPSDAGTLRNDLRIQNERFANDEKNNLKLKQERMEKFIRLINENGGIIPHEQINTLFQRDVISETFAKELYNNEKQRNNEQQRQQQKLQNEQQKQLTEQQKEQHKQDLFDQAQNIIQNTSSEGEALTVLRLLNLPVDDRETLRSHINKFFTDQNKIDTEAKNKSKDDYTTLYETVFYPRVRNIQSQKELDDFRAEIENLRKEQNPIFADNKERYNELQSELDKKQREFDKNNKTQHEEDLAARAKQIFEAHSQREGNALQYIDDATNIPEADKKILRANVKELVNTQSQIKKEQQNITQELQQNMFNDYLYDILTNVNSLDQIEQKLNEAKKMMHNNTLSMSQYNNVESILKDKKRSLETAETQYRKDKNYQTAKDLFNQYGLDGIDQARMIINEEFSREDANEIRSNFNTLVSEARDKKNRDEKAEIEQQKQNYEALFDQYWKNSQPVDSAYLQQLYNSKKISFEQFHQAQGWNAALMTREGREKSLLQNMPGFFTMTKEAREKIILESAGTTEKKRKQTVAQLLQMAAEGSLTDALVEWNYVNMQITADDKERLKEFDSKFEKAQKSLIQNKARELNLAIQQMRIPGKDATLYKSMAANSFYNNAQFIDPHDKNFSEALDEAYKNALIETAAMLSERYATEEGWFFTSPTPFGERLNLTLENANNSSTPVTIPQMLYSPLGENSISMLGLNGSQSEFVNEAKIPATQIPAPSSQSSGNGLAGLVSSVLNNGRQYYNSQNNINSGAENFLINTSNYNWDVLPKTNSQDVSTQQSQQIPQSQKSSGIVDFAESVSKDVYRISSGFSGKPTKLRNGRSHRANDYAMPEGTTLNAPLNGYSWNVLKTGENSTAGKFITLSSDAPIGNVQVTLAHLSSIDVSQGDIVNSGDHVAKSGNTGHSTGAHLHLAVKVNGVPVNPSSVDLGSPQNQVSPSQSITQPQTIISSDNDIMRFLFDDDFSNDILSSSPYGGY